MFVSRHFTSHVFLTCFIFYFIRKRDASADSNCAVDMFAWSFPAAKRRARRRGRAEKESDVNSDLRRAFRMSVYPHALRRFHSVGVAYELNYSYILGLPSPRYHSPGAFNVLLQNELYATLKQRCQTRAAEFHLCGINSCLCEKETLRKSGGSLSVTSEMFQCFMVTNDLVENKKKIGKSIKFMI